MSSLARTSDYNYLAKRKPHFGIRHNQTSAPDKTQSSSKGPFRDRLLGSIPKAFELSKCSPQNHQSLLLRAQGAVLRTLSFFDSEIKSEFVRQHVSERHRLGRFLTKIFRLRSHCQ